MNEDWDKPTILRKSRPSSKDLKSSATINQALAKGNVEISLKGILLSVLNYLFEEGASKNKRDKDAINFSKIESSEELKGKTFLCISVPKVSTEVSKAIQGGRQKLGLSQKDLAAVL